MIFLRLIVFLLSVYFTFSSEIKCNSGWIPAEKKCYKIDTKAVLQTVENICKQYATEFPKGLIDKVGFSEIVWIQKENKRKAIQLQNASHNPDVKGKPKYHSLCKESQITNATIEFHKNVAFDEGDWLIPNSKWIIEKIKEFLKTNSYNDMVWVGIVNKGSYFWTDELKLNSNQQDLLNITMMINQTTGQCGVFSLETNFTFHNCSECLNGIRISNKNASTVNTRMCLSTTTEEQSTYLSTIETTDLTTVTENLVTTPDQLTTVTENLITTPEKLTTVTQKLSTGRSSKHNSSKPCFCACNQTLSPAEFMESIKDIKVKKTEVSKYKRSKTSAPDERTSSRAIGMVAVVVMVIPFGLIILSDIPLIIQPLITYWKQKRVSTNVIP